ncbi:hypothetical protein GH714_024174 [Hevea brasiliensis]|uniref:NAB domain-containing protein n=1 Tax=Hevea brasiliensis TaxID=3981 RepID=A0A6A6LF11_HEVBR|nr:hypothetical protein GH714_024174 [Hevea brasiliensis]
MVEDFYRTHRSLAERYDQLKSDSGNRFLTTMGSPFSTKYQQQKLVNGIDQACDKHSEIYDLEDSAESEVEDPEQEEETELEEEMGDQEIERLKEENRIQREQLLQKDEEKREVIRQLSLAMEVLKLENVQLRKRVARDSTKKTSLFVFENLKEIFSRKLFNGSSKSRGSILAL